MIWENAARVLQVSDEEIKNAMRIYFEDAHSVSEGAGAAALAGALQEKDNLRGKRVGIVLSGGNVDRKTYAAVLSGMV